MQGYNAHPHADEVEIDPLSEQSRDRLPLVLSCLQSSRERVRDDTR